MIFTGVPPPLAVAGTPDAGFLAASQGAAAIFTLAEFPAFPPLTIRVPAQQPQIR